MAGFQKNPLYRAASKAVQRKARQQWNQTDAAKSIRSIRGALHGTSRTGAGTPIDKAMRQWSTGGWSDKIRGEVAGGDFGNMVKEVAKYSRMGGSTGRLVSQFLTSLGPVGSLIRAVVAPGSRIRGGGMQGDIQAALEFLDAVAPDSLSSKARRKLAGRPGQSIGSLASKRSASDVQDQIEAARDILESHGYEIKEPPGVPGGPDVPPQVDLPTGPPKFKEGPDFFPGGKPRKTKTGKDRKVVMLEVGGKQKRYPVNHPIVTGAMVPTPESTNVYAYGYAYNTSTLYVRYQQTSKALLGTHSRYPSKRPGALYAYSNVPPEVFDKMYRAPSKGTFIWDAVRIRGTVSGHKYDYKLSAVRDNYVPRKATYRGREEGEWYERRTVRVQNARTGKIRVLRSGAPMPAGGINRGLPDRGTPNRGTP